MSRTTGLSALDLSATSAEIEARGPRSHLSEADPGLVSPRSAPASPSLDRSANPVIQLTDVMGGLDIRRGSSSNGPSPPPAGSGPEFAPRPSGRLSPKQHGRDASKSFFSNLRASKSTQKLSSPESADEGMSSTTTTTTTTTPATIATESKGGRNGHNLYKSAYSVRRQGSSPELPRYTIGENTWGSGHKTQASGSLPTAATASGELQADSTASVAMAAPTTKAKSKSRFGLGLTRTKTVKLDEVNKSTSQLAQLKIDVHNHHHHDDIGPKTAPIKSDLRTRTYGGGDGSFAARTAAAGTAAAAAGAGTGAGTGTSAGTGTGVNAGGTGGTGGAGAGAGLVAAATETHIPDEMVMQRKAIAAASGGVPVSHSMHLLSNISHTGKGVGDRIGKAGKGLFGKITRSGSNNEREPGTVGIEEPYTLRTINLPLVQQTRKTRIARRLESSRDKTEFWMPALPWRCIDYLNMNGCEEEGLYRIPGSGKEVKHWQRRFDTEYDINLFEEPDLHDINTIGSMFKAWLRDLPDEILPKSIQNKVAKECAGATRTPQLFKDELSKLPPFNYYLLFAITCHLSLLTSFADKNRMDYRNLCICFQPCLKMDAFCFQFLVMDWKNCWQGCWTEKEYLEEEYRYEREGSLGESDDTTAVVVAGEDTPSSSQGQSPPRSRSRNTSSRGTNDESQSRQPPKTSDGTRRKSILQPGKARSRSASEMQQQQQQQQQQDQDQKQQQSSNTSGHQATSSMPLVPRVSTPEPPYHVPAPDKLPELGTISPIRM